MTKSWLLAVFAETAQQLEEKIHGGFCIITKDPQKEIHAKNKLESLMKNNWLAQTWGKYVF